MRLGPPRTSVPTINDESRKKHMIFLFALSPSVTFGDSSLPEGAFLFLYVTFFGRFVNRPYGHKENFHKLGRGGACSSRFVILNRLFTAADICFAPLNVKFATQTLSHRPTYKFYINL